MKIHFGNKKIEVPARKVGFFGMGRGLTFRFSSTENILFEFGKDVRRAITSWFVFFPFVAVWLDEKNRVTEVMVVKPFITSITPKKKFRRLVELPINRANREILEALVGKKV